MGKTGYFHNIIRSSSHNPNYSVNNKSVHWASSNIMKKDNSTNNITNITQNNNNSNQTNKKSEKETAVDLPHKFFDEKASLVKNCLGYAARQIKTRIELLT